MTDDEQRDKYALRYLHGKEECEEIAGKSREKYGDCGVGIPSDYEPLYFHLRFIGDEPGDDELT